MPVLCIFLLIGFAIGCKARKTGRNLWLWSLYGFVAFPVAAVHVFAAKPPSEGGTGTFGQALAISFSIPVGIFSLLMVIFSFAPTDRSGLRPENGGDYIERHAERQRAEAEQGQQKADEQAQQKAAKPKTATKPTETAKTRITFQSASQFPDGSAERRLALFVEAWRDADWSRMASYCQLTWLDGQTDPEGILDASFGFQKPVGFEITATQGGNAFQKICFKLWYTNRWSDIQQTEVRSANVIKETAPYKCDPNGTWGVNATSALGSGCSLDDAEVTQEVLQSLNQSESPFEPSAIIGRLQKPLICQEAKQLQWQRHDLGNGTERWLGSTPSEELLFEITPDYLYVMASVSSPSAAGNSVLACGELNSIVFPADYYEITKNLLGEIAEKVDANDGSVLTMEVNGWLLETQEFPTLGSVSYKVSKAEKK